MQLSGPTRGPRWRSVQRYIASVSGSERTSDFGRPVSDTARRCLRTEEGGRFLDRLFLAQWDDPTKTPLSAWVGGSGRDIVVATIHGRFAVGSRTDEFLDIVLRLWKGESVTFNGKLGEIDARIRLRAAGNRRQRPRRAAVGQDVGVGGIDRLGRNAAEVMTTIRELGERGIVLRSLREGIDTSNATGRMVAGVLASLAELELELGRERRAAARDARRARGQSIGRPKALDKSQSALAHRMHASGESAATIAKMLKVSRATVYRVLAHTDDQ